MPSLEQNTQRKKQLEGFFITYIDPEYLQDIIKIFVFFVGYDQQLDFTKSFHPYELYIALQQQEEDVDLVNCIGQSLFQLIWQKLVIEKKKIFEEYSKGPFGQDSILYPFLCLQRKLTENDQQLLEQITYYTWYESYKLMKASKRIIELAIYGKDNIISFQSKLKKKNQEEQELQLKIKKLLSFEFIQNDEINQPDKYEIEEYKEIVLKYLKERDFIKLNSPFVSSFINEKDKRKEQLNFKLVKDLILSSEEIWQDHCSKYYQSRWQTPHQRNHFKEIIESGQHSRTLAEKLHYFFTEMQTSKQIYFEIKPNYQYFEPEMNFDKLEKYGDKLKVSEKQIQFWKNDQIVLKKMFEKIIQNIKENDSLVQLFLISLFLFDKVDTYAIKNEKFVVGLRKKAKQRQEFIEQNENQFKSQFEKKTKLLQQNKKLRTRRNQIDYSDSESNEDSSEE
ncbi:hypothetical protein PPERSA_09612 [Pseudocohnilembus persalinus]|uniref:Uncharacterized protein n=1 Tax=Pseudocohnilembus persalinus TaxID=266149 RepID=A0A0V0QFN0_PSEPJ|nr:hypothetical protein PPERSA_09612 [Pseudocohnilembus persalinus]|eukprot:KRX01006.1 hypothetical protein PPERSA_09612 [Pseudocohnilembus persalinus]